MRVGLFGGSFNPAHEGHAHVAETARVRLKLDRVVWLVSPQNPLKPAHGTASLAERMASASMQARGPSMIVSDAETRLGSPYTLDTVLALKARFPGVRFVWIMGADNLGAFHRWRGLDADHAPTARRGDRPAGRPPPQPHRPHGAPLRLRAAAPRARRRSWPTWPRPAWIYLRAPAERRQLHGPARPAAHRRAAGVSATPPGLSARTAEHMRGRAEIVEADPPLELHSDVYATPHVEEGRWGVFGADDKPIALAVERGLDPLQAPAPSPRKPAQTHGLEAARAAGLRLRLCRPLRASLRALPGGDAVAPVAVDRRRHAANPARDPRRRFTRGLVRDALHPRRPSRRWASPPTTSST